MSAIQRFKRRCLDLDGNTNLKSKAGHYGNDSSIVSNTAQFADRKFRAEKFNEFYTWLQQWDSEGRSAVNKSTRDFPLSRLNRFNRQLCRILHVPFFET